MLVQSAQRLACREDNDLHSVRRGGSVSARSDLRHVELGAGGCMRKYALLDPFDLEQTTRK
jgi:hypothetical protein